VTGERLRILAATIALLAISQVAGAADYAPDAFVHVDIVTDPDPGRFSVCHGGTCAIVSQAALDENEWAKIAAIFARSAANAEAERARIAAAIAQFETLVGAITDTSDDRAENQLGKSWSSQMDCIDESTNSTTYLRILARRGLLRFHRVEARSTRGYFVFGWPHTTAVVRELKTGARWAVDSWFHENGQPPAIVPLEAWRAGWRPVKPPPVQSL
jgi:hypothetical protein